MAVYPSYSFVKRNWIRRLFTRVEKITAKKNDLTEALTQSLAHPVLSTHLLHLTLKSTQRIAALQIRLIDYFIPHSREKRRIKIQALTTIQTNLLQASSSEELKSKLITSLSQLSKRAYDLLFEGRTRAMMMQLCKENGLSNEDMKWHPNQQGVLAEINDQLSRPDLQTEERNHWHLLKQKVELQEPLTPPSPSFLLDHPQFAAHEMLWQSIHTDLVNSQEPHHETL